MESLYFLIPFALVFIVIAVKVLFWAINSGQYDNLDTEAHRILFDDEKTKSDTSELTSTTSSSASEQSTLDSPDSEKHQHE